MKLLQQAAGIFHHLKNITSSVIPVQPTTDLTATCLNALANIMLAQAQEVFIIKLIKDNGKELLIAKLCAQCEEMYAEALKSMQNDGIRNIWAKEWIPLIAGKQAGFHAMLYLFVSLNHRNSKEIGKEIACLQKSIDLFKAAQQRSADSSLFVEFMSKAQKNLIESKRDNDFIYNEQIPNANDLSPPGKLVLAKLTAVLTPLSKDFDDIFKELVPVAVHKALVSSEIKRNEITNNEIVKLRDATQTLNT